MDGDQRFPYGPGAGQALDQAQAFLQRLIPFASPGSVEPASLLPMPARGGPAKSNSIDGAAAALGEPVASIVSQAASILDEEMARGLLDARNRSLPAPAGFPNAGQHPVLRQMQDFVEKLATAWPSLQGMAEAPGTQRPANSDAAPLARVKPRASVEPGEQATISMTLRNSQSRPVRLVPAATDLIGSRGGRIPNSLLQFTPSEIALEPREQRELVITATVPGDAAPGCYSGLLVVEGQDELRALVTIDVIGTTGSPERTQPLPLPQTAVGNGAMPSFPAAGPAPLRSGDNSLVQEAAKLARDGELGNSDAIRLLQMPHRPEDLEEVLARFEKQMTAEARSKLTLETFAPLPEGVDNQRYEPIFDRYPITGKTYTTASGTVVLNEVQYYNGEMVQLYGGCANIAAVRGALAGSGYKPMTLRQADGRESAIVQFWSHQLTDTSLKPYKAMFVIVAAVSDDTPASQACIRADANGASSVLSMLGGRFDPARRVYENHAHLFFVRLLDSTRVAIEVGRERMGTDKRPGTIELRREGQERTFSVRNGAGHAVARIRFVPEADSSACLSEITKAAATAGISVRALPGGTEYVYPGLARIGHGAVVRWEWRTDVTPRFQQVRADTVVFDASSEEGSMLIGWGFEPRVLGYIPNVRGVVTGIPETGLWPRAY